MINIDLWLLAGVICSHLFLVPMLWCSPMAHVIPEYTGRKNTAVSSVVPRKAKIEEDSEKKTTRKKQHILKASIICHLPLEH